MEPTFESIGNSDNHSSINGENNQNTPNMGGGLSIIQYWAEHTLSPEGPKLWQTLLHKSSCLSCAWGTGGQKGGFANEEGETLQRCMKSVEAISSELQPGINKNFFARYSLEELQQLTSLEADRLGRLSFPVILRKDRSHYEPITYSEIYQIVERAFRQSPERVASYSSGRSSNEAAFLLQLMMRALGSNNLADCSDLCHAASTVGLRNMFGNGTSMVSLEGLKQADCVVLIGSNAPANHPRLMNELIKLRDRGGKVIVINPVREVGLVKFASPAYPLTSLLAGTPISSLYLQPIPGSDVAIFVGIQKSLIEKNALALDYLQAHTEGWEQVVEQAKNTTWEEIIAICGLTREEIEAAAAIIANSQAVVFAWAMGVTQQENSVDNIYSISNTALLTGNAGKIGAGTMPIRGHSNVQGFGSMGVSIHLKEEVKQALEKAIGHSLSRVPGYDTRALIEAADEGKVDTLICLGGNLYAANPNTTQAKRALSKIDTVIYLATKPNLGHFHGLGYQNTIIIPVYNRFENPHKTTTESGNNFVRLNDEGKTHLHNADLIAEVEFIAELAHRLLGANPVQWRKLQDTEYIRELIGKTIPGYEEIAQIDRTKKEFIVGGRVFTEPKFPTPSGKAAMFVTPLPQLTIAKPEDFGILDSHKSIAISLITGRSYSQHNTVVYKIADKYRGMPHRNCIMMNARDAQSIGVAEHQLVNIKGDAGILENIEVIYGAIRQGAGLMFYPEANILFTSKADPRAGTPAFKRVPAVVYLGK
jgi:molybdopterin-dependent oxidoreductase alpha subunit